MKNKELVSRMSVEERIRLVTSTKLGQNCSVGNYKFPVFKLSNNPAAEAEGGYATLFPSDKALASTWNAPLVRDIYKCYGNEAKANKENPYFTVSNSLAEENISEDYYFAGCFLASKANGVNLSGAYLNFENTPQTCDERELRESVKQITDFVMREAEPNSVLFHSVEEAERFPERYGYEGMLYGVASNKEEAACYLYLGCSLVFLKEDFTEELISYLTDLTVGFEKAYKDHKAGKMSLAEFDRRQRNLEILDCGLLDTACDKIVSALLGLKEACPASVQEKPLALDATHTPKFNENFHDTLALRAAQHSAILLKNNANALPFDNKFKIAVIGEYAKNPEYQTELTGNKPTAVRVPFEAVNDYELNAIGYAHGYLKGQSGRTDLLSTATSLCAEADFALVYLSAEQGERALPAGQLELISALAEKGVKIAAVVSADGAIDLSFTKHCEAVLFTYRGGQASANAVLDILTGKVCPSGKLAESFPASEEGEGYPFGFGLSYTKFKYTNLKITENGVSCTVTNTGNCGGFAVVQMYVQKDGTETALSQKRLRGYTKVYVKKNDAVKVEIPFDGNTFRVYDFKTGHYCIEGGDYNVYIAENAETVNLSGELTLSHFVYKNEIYENERVENDENAPVGFTTTQSDKAIRKAKKSLSFGLKLFLAVTLMLYYNAVGAVLLLTNLVAGKTLAFYISVGVLLAIGDVLAIVYIIIISDKRKQQKYLHPNDVLSDMVDKVSDFAEIAKITYKEPVPAQEEEPLAEDEDHFEEAAAEEAEAKVYDDSFGEGEADEVAFTQQVSLAELCSNFRAYALERGVAVEPSSVRAIFAAISSAKLVFLSCKNREVLPELLTVLNDYFGIRDYVSASDEWQSPGDLLWRQGEEKYVTSEFSNAVNAAGKAPEKNCIAIVNNVNLQNLKSYFGSFIEYALYPSEEHTLELGGGLTLRLPNNLCYMLVPSAEDFAEQIPSELARASLQVDVIASNAEKAEQVTEAKTLSRNDFAELITEAREKCYLSEKIWKKIDALAEAIGATERFEIGNKDVLQLEKFSAVLMDCGGDEHEAAMGVFTAKIVPLLKTLKTYRKEDGGKTICGIIEKLFGDEDISKIQKLLI